MQWSHVALAGRSGTPNKRHNNRDLLESACQKAQLVQLADSVSQKGASEIDEIGNQNSELVSEWLEAFRHEEDRARSEMEFWHEASEHLSKAGHTPTHGSTD